MGQKQAQRVRAVSGREQAVGATSKGLEGLDEARQELLAGAVRRPTVAERERIVEAAEGRIEADLARRKEALGATSAGAALLREEYGDGGVAADARLQSFAEREAVLDQIEERVDEELEAQEGALRSIPLGKQYLWEAEQARPGGVAGSPPLAERESIVNTATGRVEEEFDRREKNLAANADNENLLVEVAGDLELDGGTLTLGERWRVLEASARRLEEERAELEGKEAAILEDPAGAEFLRNAQLEMLGDADREANTLADRGRVIMAAEAALQKAAAKRQADQEWEKKKAAREQALARRPGGADLYHAHLANLDPQWSLKENNTTARENLTAALSAAESDGPRLERLRVVLSDEAAATRYRKELGKVAVQFKTADLDRALSSAEQERAERETRRWEEKRDASVEAVDRLPGGMDLYYAHLADRDPAWSLKKNDTTSRGNINAALDAARSDNRRLERLRVVLSDAAAATRYREVLDDSAAQFTTADLDRALAAGEREWEEREAAARRAAALETATATAQAAAARSNIELHDAHVRVIYETGETHATGLAAVDRTTEALALAADQELPSETIVDTWKANQSDPGGIAAALDRASSAQRVSRLERLFSVPGAGEAFITALDEQDPSWRTRTHPRTINRALDIAERDLGRETRVPWHARVLNAAEQQFPGASNATWRRAGDHFTGAADTDRHGRSVSQALSDRARARALAGEGPSAEPEPARDLVQQVTDLLRTDVERQQLEARTGAARLAQRNQNSLRPVVEPSPPVPKPARLVPTGATWEDAKPQWRALTDLQERTGRGRLAQRARNSVTAVPEKTPPSPRRARLVPDATREDAEQQEPSRLTFAERYSRHWPEHADNIHHPDFEELAVGAASRNKLFERQRRYSSKWTTVEPEELPLSLAKAAPAWDEDEVKRVTWLVTPGVGDPERTLQRQIVDAHLDDYEHRLPAQYAHSAEWRAIQELAEEAIKKLQHSWWYKRADRKGKRDDRKKRKLEAAAINRECGRDARRLHKEMMAARAAARPDWEVTVRIRAVQGATRDERIKLEDAARKENLDQRGLTEPPPGGAYQPPQPRASHDRAHRGRR